MPIRDISKVTLTLMKLIDNRVKLGVDSSDWLSEVSVVSSPPDLLKGNATLGLYLYHLSEDSAYKNQQTISNDQPPVRFTPMGLNLYYQLVPHSSMQADTTPDVGIQREQRMMGLAVKALRDYPVIDHTTEVNGVNILEEELSEDKDKLRIMLQPVQHTEVSSFWTAGKTSIRLAAYYLVSVALLHPEETKTRVGRVLSYGAYSFVSGSPRLESSENKLTFNPDPSEVDEPREITIRSAQVPYGSELQLNGTSLGGEEVYIVLSTPRWDQPGVIDDSIWNIRGNDNKATATIHSTVQTKTSDPLATELRTILPGIYGVNVRVVKYRTTSSGEIKRFEYSSNMTPFMVTPRIDGADVRNPTPGGAVSIDGYGFSHPDLPDIPDVPEKPIKVYIGDTQLSEGTAGALNPAEYSIESTLSGTPPLPDDPQTLNLVVPNGLPSGTLVPVRIVVNGAESPPKWLQIQ